MIWFGLILYSVVVWFDYMLPVQKYYPVSGVRNKLNSMIEFWR